MAEPSSRERDEARARAEREAAQALVMRCRADFELFAKHCLKVRDVDGHLQPFILNRMQKKLHASVEDQLRRTGKVRKIILKARQMGSSTYIQGRFYWRLWRSTDRALQAFVLTHRPDATENLFGMAKRFQDNLPETIRPPLATSNAKQLIFADTQSGYQVDTAGAKEVGRGETFQLVHACLSPDTFVLLASGAPVRLASIAPGDAIRTHTGAVARVSAISVQRRPVRAVKVLGANEPLIASADHRFWTKRGWVRVEDLTTADHIGTPVAKLEGDVFTWPFRLADRARPQGGGTREVGPDVVYSTYELGRVLGLYLAEGSLKRQNSGVLASVVFSVHEREVARTLAWLKPLGDLFRNAPAVRPLKNSKTVHVVVNGRSFATLLRTLCGETETKRLPDAWRAATPQFVRGLCHGYLAGDGHSAKRLNNRRITAPSIRGAITFGMRDALASLGYGWATVRYRAASVRSGRNEKAQWTIDLMGSGVDALCEELGWLMPRRRRAGQSQLAVENGFGWNPVVSISPLDERETIDLEIAHENHSFCVWQGASHNSEMPFWENADAHVISLLTTALSKGLGSEGIIESTANGVGNVFHRYWQAAVRGDSQYEAEFFPWFWHDIYAMDCPEEWVPTEDWINYAELHGLTWEQLYWAFTTSQEMAKAISEPDDKPCTKFMQEYPATAEEAFQTSGNSFIPAKSVYIARKNTDIIGRGPVILGVDPARGGKTPDAGSGKGGKTPERTGDKVGIIDRCGRRLGERICERMDPGGNLVYVATQVARIIDRIRPDAVNIDVGGNGAAIYDNLLEWGYERVIFAVNFGSNPVGRGPTGEEMYFNRRAEMWDLMRDWFNSEGGVRVPDTDDFQQDVTAPMWGPGACRHNANNELILEDKDQIKKRLGWSPDLGDAAALTFSVPMSFLKSASQQPPPQRKRSRRTGY